MYQVIVLGVGFSLLFGGAYFIKKADDNGVLAQAFSSQKIEPNVSLTADDVAGVYVCDKNSGCLNSYSIKLSVTGESQLLVSSDNGDELLSESGSWKFENGGLITLLFTDSLVEHYEIPHSMLIQSVGTTTLSKIVYDSKFYTDIHKPSFVKQGE